MHGVRVTIFAAALTALGQSLASAFVGADWPTSVRATWMAIAASTAGRAVSTNSADPTLPSDDDRVRLQRQSASAITAKPGSKKAWVVAPMRVTNADATALPTAIRLNSTSGGVCRA